MDPPPPPNPSTLHLNYPDSVDSSPRSNATDTYNEPLPPVPGAKLRIMCSYGGHIIPRPHDKSLCYVGGETRMVAIDRHSTLSSLCARLSRTLVNGRGFTLKYQLPNEDLDSLVSVTTDEDLDHLMEEYDHITRSSSALSHCRIRLFLFFNKPETAASMGSLLDDAKSENWFVDALNGSRLLQSKLYDSATMECLVCLENDPDSEAQDYGGNGVERDNKEAKNSSLPDSPLMENGSSFGSSSSSPSMCNLPPIRVEDQKGGIEEQFAQITFAQAVRKQLPISMNLVSDSNENLDRMISDDERSDHGVPVSFRKPPLAPLQAAPPQKGGVCYGLPSPDSVSSDTSIASANSLTISSHHFVPQPAVAPAPMTSYFPVYTTRQQQIPMDQHYPVYVMPISQIQPYISVPANMVDSKDAHPPVYTPKIPAATGAAYAETATVHRTGATGSPAPLVHIQSGQFQQPFVVQHPPQSVAVTPSQSVAVTGPGNPSYNYVYEYANTAHDQLYYTGHPHQAAATLPPQYQTMTPAAAVAMADASSQLPSSNVVQHIVTSQPL